MKSVFSLVMLFSLQLMGADDNTQRAKSNLELLCRVLPEIFWYAGDMCLRETTTLGGHINKREEFVAAYKAEILGVERKDEGGKIAYYGKVKLHDPNDRQRYWIFEFVHRGQSWEAILGQKHNGNDAPMDIYKADGSMGSMKPYVEKGLAAFKDSKKPSDVNWSNK